MKVHKRTAPGDTVAVCGEAFNKRQRGLDFCDSWDPNAPHPVTCVDCLMHKPPRWKTRPWNAFGKKTR